MLIPQILQFFDRPRVTWVHGVPRLVVPIPRRKATTPDGVESVVSLHGGGTLQHKGYG